MTIPVELWDNILKHCGEHAMKLIQAYPKSFFSQYIPYNVIWNQDWTSLTSAVFVSSESNVLSMSLNDDQLQRLRNLMGPLPFYFLECPEIMVLAGGAALYVYEGHDTPDLDFFVFDSSKAISKFQAYLTRTDNQQEFVISRNNILEIRPIKSEANNYIRKIQLIFAGTYATPLDVLLSFDFTCNRAYLSSSHIYHTFGFSIALTTKRTFTSQFVTSKRMARIKEKGFLIQNPQMIHVGSAECGLPNLADMYMDVTNTTRLCGCLEMGQYHLFRMGKIEKLKCLVWDGIHLKILFNSNKREKENTDGYARSIVIMEDGRRVPLHSLPPMILYATTFHRKCNEMMSYFVRPIGPLIVTTN